MNFNFLKTFIRFHYFLFFFSSTNKFQSFFFHSKFFFLLLLFIIWNCNICFEKRKCFFAKYLLPFSNLSFILLFTFPLCEKVMLFRYEIQNVFPSNFYAGTFKKIFGMKRILLSKIKKNKYLINASVRLKVLQRKREM